jgi:dihydrolipoamide dehydrogenase
MEEVFDVIFVGGGPAGYVGAIKAAQLGLKTACIEKGNTLGGTCLNVGCIPSKALLHLTEGIKPPIDLVDIMHKKEGVVKKLTAGIEFLFKKNKVTRILGEGRVISPNVIEVAGKGYKAKNIVLATGSSPISLPFLPFDEKKILSSTGALSLMKIPEKMIVIGGGVIGLELGSVYARMGTKIEVVEFMPDILSEFEEDISKGFRKILEGQGFVFHLQSKVTAGVVKDDYVELEVETPEGKKKLFGDVVLVSIGRRPNHKGCGIENIGIEVDQRGFIKIDNSFRTSIPNIYAVGDVAGPPMLAHKGSEEAIVVAEFLAGDTLAPLDYASIPNVVYTNPEIASVGFGEKELIEKKIPYNKAVFPFIGNSRYIANGGVDHCFIKAFSHKESGHLLGCHILAPHASELIQGPTIAMKARLKVSDLATTTFAHPTLSEALHEVFLTLSSGKPIHI